MIFLLKSQNISVYSVQIGVNDRSNPETWSTSRTVSEIFMHPSFSSLTMKNNIALFKLSVKMLKIMISPKRNFIKKIFF